MKILFMCPKYHFAKEMSCTDVRSRSAFAPTASGALPDFDAEQFPNRRAGTHFAVGFSAAAFSNAETKPTVAGASWDSAALN
jgi:hypothetical protein